MRRVCNNPIFFFKSFSTSTIARSHRTGAAAAAIGQKQPILNHVSCALATNNNIDLLVSDVHGSNTSTFGKKAWRNKPLFRRGGMDKKFRTGMEASEMLYEEAVRRDPYQTGFLQYVKTFLDSIHPVFDRYPKYAWVMKQLLEPERAIQFRVPWIDDSQNSRVNRGYRVQFSSVLGPYHGGTRFHRSVSHGSMKFLAMDNVFRNALAGDFGGAAGGSDFDPMHKSESEVMRFCQSYMTELSKYIGPNLDIPGAGLGVGQKEIGYMFGQFKRLRQIHSTGTEGIISGGQYWYPQATGHGLAYFAECVLNDKAMTLEGKRVSISGCGMTALHMASKLVSMGAKVLSFSDSSGYIIEPEGFTMEKLATLIKIKSDRNARIGAYIMTSTTAQYHPTGEGSVWDTKCDFAFPCAAEYEIDGQISKKLVENGCTGIFAGTSMPCTEDAIHTFLQNKIPFAPWKTSNSGALAFHGLNIHGLSDDQVDKLLKTFMENMYSKISAKATEYNATGDLMTGANIYAFLRVAEASLNQGTV